MNTAIITTCLLSLYVFTTRWDDAHPDHPKMAAALESAGAKGTFMYCGKPNAKTAAAMKDLAARGHGIGAHTISHQFMNRLVPNAQFREILECRIENELASQSGVYVFALPMSSASSVVEPCAAERVEIAAKNAGILGRPENFIRGDDRNPKAELFLKGLAAATNAIARGKWKDGRKVTYGVHNWSDDAGRARIAEFIKPFTTSPEVVNMNENEYAVKELHSPREEFYFPRKIVRLEPNMNYDGGMQILHVTFENTTGGVLTDVEFALRLPFGYQPGVRTEARKTIAAGEKIKFDWPIPLNLDRSISEGDLYCALETNARDQQGAPIRFWQVFDIKTGGTDRAVPRDRALVWNEAKQSWQLNKASVGAAEYVVQGVNQKDKEHRFRFAFLVDTLTHGEDWKIVFTAVFVKNAQLKVTLNGQMADISKPVKLRGGVNDLEIVYPNISANYSWLGEIVVKAVKDGAKAPFVMPSKVKVNLPRRISPTEETAADELIKYLYRHGGKVNATFHLGDTKFAAANKLAMKDFATDGWAVKSFGDQVVINGGAPRGVLYATWHFLEDVCGVRWWSHCEEEIIGAGEPIATAQLDLSGVPAFKLRDIYTGVQGDAKEITSYRLRENGAYSRLPEARFGGGFAYGRPSACHTFDSYVPAEKYLVSHPEWFSYVKRTRTRAGGDSDGQICLVNREVREIVKRRLREYIKADREEYANLGVPAPYVYDISENDNWNYCECDGCEKAVEKWGRSGLMLDFLNDIADSIRDEYPEILVNTFAYHGTELPPLGGMKARDNVMVRLCDTRSSIVTGHYEKDNLVFSNFLQTWLRSVKHISIWDYAINYTRATKTFPMPSEWHYEDLFRYGANNGVFGFFWEHESFNAADAWELKYYVEHKLLENPNLDTKALVKKFCKEYYGKAASIVHTYRIRLDEVRRKSHGQVTWFPSLSEFDWIDDAALNEFEKLSAEAKAIVKGDKLHEERVTRAFQGVHDLRSERNRRLGGNKPEFVSDDFFTCTDERPRTIYHFDGAIHRSWRCDMIDVETPSALPVITLRDAAGKIKQTFNIPNSGKGGEYFTVSLGKIKPEKGDEIWLRPNGRLRYNFTYRQMLLGREGEFRMRLRFTGRDFEKGSIEPNRVWLGEFDIISGL